MTYAYFPEKYRNREGWLNLREAATKLGLGHGYLNNLRYLKRFPQEVKTYRLKGQRGGIYIQEADLSKLAEVINNRKQRG